MPNMTITVILLSLVVITIATCRLFYSTDLPPIRRGSTSVSAFQTTFYSAVPLPAAMNPDAADVFQTSVPYRPHYQAVADCLQDPSSAVDSVDYRQSRVDISSSAAVVVGNGCCPAVDLAQDDIQGRPRPRQRCPQPVLVRAVEGLFFPGSIAALLLTVAAVLCVDAAAVNLESLARSLVDVDALKSLLERDNEDSPSFLSTELISSSCIDHVHLDVLQLTSLLHRRPVSAEGRPT